MFTLEICNGNKITNVAYLYVGMNQPMNQMTGATVLY